MRLTRPLTILLLLPFCLGASWGEKSKTDKPVESTPKAVSSVAPDANKDGKISADEKKRALELWSAEEKTEDSAAEKAIAAQGDTDRDGKLEAEEKKRLMQELSGAPAEAPSKKGEKK